MSVGLLAGPPGDLRGEGGSYLRLRKSGYGPVCTHLSSWFFLFVLFFGCEGHSQELPAGPVLTNLHQVVGVGKEAVRHTNYSAVVRGVVTFPVLSDPWVFIQDEGQGMLVIYKGNPGEYPLGALLEVEGPVKAGLWAPFVEATQVRVLGTAELPLPVRADPVRLAAGDDFARYVVVRGFVRDVAVGWNSLTLLLSGSGEHFPAQINIPTTYRLPLDWLDAEVEIRGLCWTRDLEGRPVTFTLHAVGTNSITILRPGTAALFDRPLRKIASLSDVPADGSVRVKIQGVVSHQSASGTFFISDETGPVRISPLRILYKGSPEGQYLDHQQLPLQVGDRVEVIGAPVRSAFLKELEDAEYHVLGHGPTPDPISASAASLASGDLAGQLVTLRARILDRETRREGLLFIESLTLDAGHQVFEATLEHEKELKLPLERDQYLLVTGVNSVQAGQWGKVRASKLLLRSPADLMVVSPPAWWEKSGNLRALGIGLALALLVAVWVAFQRRQVARLRASEERFRAVIENSFDATFVLDAEGGVKYASPAGLSLVGHTGDSTSLRIADVVHPDDVPRIVEAHMQVVANPGQARKVSGYRVMRADGSIRFAEAIGTNCLNVPGVRGVVVNIRDITERMQADETVRRSEMVTRTINNFATSLLAQRTEDEVVWDLVKNCISQLGFADCVVYLLDPERNVLVQKAALGMKNPSGQVILNPIVLPLGKGIVGSVAAQGRAEVIADTNLDPRYLVDESRRRSEITVPIIANGRVIGVIDSEHAEPNFFTPDHLAMLNAIASLCANKLVRVWAEQELIVLNADLEKRVVDRTAELRQANGRLHSEVAAREQAEAELRVALAAEKELNQLKSSFVSMVSHEFRTPLEVILSSVNLLDRYLDRLTPEKRRQQFRAVHKSIVRMNDLIEDVLILGKFDAGGLSCQPVRLELPSLCRRAVAEIESAANREGAVRMQMQDIGGEALVDEGLLHHVLTNLLSNALKYSKTPSPVEFQITRNGNTAEFVVRDHGCGIPVADQARLFTAFYRGGNVGQTPGSGLGLVIAKRCVDLCGGRIRCESREGEGTSFFVSLPLFDDTRQFHRRTTDDPPHQN